MRTGLAAVETLPCDFFDAAGPGVLGLVAPHLIVVQSHLSLGRLETFLHRPALAGRFHRGGQRRRGRCMHQIEALLRHASTEEKPPRLGPLLRIDSDSRPVIPTRSLGRLEEISFLRVFREGFHLRVEWLLESAQTGKVISSSLPWLPPPPTASSILASSPPSRLLPPSPVPFRARRRCWRPPPGHTVATGSPRTVATLHPGHTPHLPPSTRDGVPRRRPAGAWLAPARAWSGIAPAAEFPPDDIGPGPPTSAPAGTVRGPPGSVPSRWRRPRRRLSGNAQCGPPCHCTAGLLPRTCPPSSRSLSHPWTRLPPRPVARGHTSTRHPAAPPRPSSPRSSCARLVPTTLATGPPPRHVSPAVRSGAPPTPARGATPVPISGRAPLRCWPRRWRCWT